MIDQRVLPQIKKNIDFTSNRILSSKSSDTPGIVEVQYQDINGRMETFRYKKVDISRKVGLSQLAVGKIYDYTTDVLEELNELYDLVLTRDDIVVEKIQAMEFTLKISKDSLYYTGSLEIKMTNETLDIIEILDNQVEVHLDLNTYINDPKYLVRHLNFDYMAKDLSSLNVGDNIDENLKSLLDHRLEGWIRVPEYRAKNLYGCIVECNGPSELRTKEQDSVLRLRLNPKYCSSHSGSIELYYTKLQ